MRSSCFALGLGALLLAACVEEPLAPADWDTTLVEVSPCTQSGDHSGRFVRILITAGQETTYRTKSGTFPEGTLVLKPEYADERCTDLEELTAMSKAPADAKASPTLALGWWWQSMSPDLKVNERPLESCISCHRTCAGRFDATCLER